MRKLIVAALFTLIIHFGFSQVMSPNGPIPYKVGIGLKYMPATLSVKAYSKSGHAYEFLLIDGDGVYRLTSLLELDMPLSKSGNVRFVLGGGAHIGWHKTKPKNSYASNPVFGVDVIVGGEIKIPKTPFAIQLDLQPGADLVGNNEFYYKQGGLTIRYCF